MPKAKQETPSMRLQKFLADCGVTSRRKAEELIVQGKVKVNGRVVKELGTKVIPDEDVVEYDGKPLNLLSVDKIYVLLNKPRGVVTTVHDPEGRSTVIDYCKGIDARIFPVGRLDYSSEGLLLLTNDGEMANMIMHPRYEVTKVYEVKVFGQMTEAILAKLRAGMYFPEGFVKPVSVRVIETMTNKTWVEFRLQEGKNREIRRLCEAVGLTVDKLRRVAIEGLTIQGLAPGHYILLTKKELMHALGINEDGTKKKKATHFVSAKKTITLKDKVTRHALAKNKLGEKKVRLADDPAFQKYRRENYKKTIELQNEFKEEFQEKNEEMKKLAQKGVKKVGPKREATTGAASSKRYPKRTTRPKR